MCWTALNIHVYEYLLAKTAPATVHCGHPTKNKHASLFILTQTLSLPFKIYKYAEDDPNVYNIVSSKPVKSDAIWSTVKSLI